jgi:hypothetical protein
MAVTATVLDGNNVALAFNGTASANVFTLNTSTGAVSSAYLSDTWTRVLRQNALKLFSVTTVAQRETVLALADGAAALGRLAIGDIPGAGLLGTSSAQHAAAVHVRRGHGQGGGVHAASAHLFRAAASRSAACWRATTPTSPTLPRLASPRPGSLLWRPWRRSSCCPKA